ncbi:acyltransferase family protein [Commensalibacter oyaizuii]|uniref:Acyltransferase n=1 Tax=Commensalibacter oyaizuii TaxID=3043873 RepID=A0ABT6PY73_9PROT|nr:acyltransferase [Commensalibacter sp. TBRC 16381]MDI2089803.1 acyltransferase [Commensalibacter sp. TBRC 16381]
MLLKNLLHKENNNLDIFRLLAALMVIYAHTYPLLPIAGKQDPLFTLLSFEDIGGLAVKIFFFLSGLVVTNSLLTKRNVIAFVISRIFRILPALLTVLVATTFIIGPVVSTFSLHRYFTTQLTYVYFFKNIFLQSEFFLPGVFQSNAYTVVNGSLWTLPIEASCYIVLATLFLIGIFRYKPLCLVVFVIIILDPIFDNHLLITCFADKDHHSTLLAPCFAFGCLLSVYKDFIKINLSLVVATTLLYFLFRNSSYNFYFFYLCIFTFILYSSSTKLCIHLKPSADVSYGIYLWSFPIQQIMIIHFAKYGILFNQVTTMLIATGFGLISWYLIEKRCIAFGQYINKNLSVSKIFKHEKSSFILNERTKNL